MEKFTLKIQFDVTKEDLEQYANDDTKTIGDIRKNIKSLFEDDYENVLVNIEQLSKDKN